MCDVYMTLKNLEYFIENEYLEKYSRIIEYHTRTPVLRGRTHKHHIVPKSWFKLTNNSINDELNNLVNLPTREHILAHYYLCLCTQDPFKYANQLALVCLQSEKYTSVVDKALIQNLPLYKNIYENYKEKLKSNYRLYD